MLMDSQEDKLLEEASCDYRSLIETLSIYKYVDEEGTLIKQIHDCFHINQTFLSYLSNILSCWNTLYKTYIKVDSYDDLVMVCQPVLNRAAQIAIIRNSIIPDFLDNLSIKKYGVKSYNNILDNSFIKLTLHEVADKVVNLNFMLYVIEESIRLSKLPHYNPFELKNIVLQNAGYISC